MKITALLVLWTQLYIEATHGDVCNTPGCLEIADLFRNMMDLSVNPCDDFYSFACGKLLDSTVIPDDAAQYGVTEEIDKEIREKLRIELESKTLKGLPRSFVKAQNFYFSCMDEETIEKVGLRAIKQRLRSYGGWPLVQRDWKEDKFDWLETTKRLTRVGEYNDQIFSVYIDISAQNSSKRMIQLDTSYHTLSYRRLLAGLDNEITRTYYDVLVNISMEFGACPLRAKREMLEALQFEVDLVNISLSGSTLVNPMKISEVQKKYPYIPWLSYIRFIMGSSVKITEQEVVNVLAPGYFEQLGSLLKRTPKRVLANFILSQVVFTNRENLNRRILEFSWSLQKVRFGKTDLPTRWEFCLGKLFYPMSAALGAAYVRNYFSRESKTKAIEMASLFRDAFASLVDTEEWMDTKTRARAVEKVKNIKYYIGYPEEFLNDTVLDQYYSGVIISRSDLYGNGLSLWKWRNDRSNQKLRQPVVSTSWDVQTLEYVILANANYSPLNNRIDVLAATLQKIFFAVDRPDFLNFGTLASVYGHEYTHSVDNQGRMHDKDGNLENWWSNETDEAFKKKALAIVDEYSTYVVKEVNLTLNGKLIEGEVIADHGGYKMARLGLERWLSVHGQENPRLAGFEQYTAQQLFWLGAAGSWCTKERPELVKTLVEENVHPPSKFRVNGPFRHSFQFAADWACPIGSYMNPQYKVNVW